MDYRQCLAGVDFLSTASDELLAEIARDVRIVKAREYEEIFAEGVPGDAMYVIVEGKVRLVKDGMTLLTRRAGDYFGEMALLDEAPRSAAAVAAADVELLSWHKDAFLKTVQNSGPIAYNVCRSLSARIRDEHGIVMKARQDRKRAAQVQRAMLPECDFSHPILELSARCLQADDVGGDLFDYVPFDGQVALTVADAEGHGFSAALLVSMIKTRLHSALNRYRAPRKVMTSLNRTILAGLADMRIVTCCYVLVDGRRRRLRFANAGHLPQYHFRGDRARPELLEATGIPLGIYGQEEFAYLSEERSWEPGDLLVLCTDGLTEARNAAGEEFGSERLVEVLSEHRHREPREIHRAVLKRLESFMDGVDVTDDVTLVVSRLKESGIS